MMMRTATMTATEVVVALQEPVIIHCKYHTIYIYAIYLYVNNVYVIFACRIFGSAIRQYSSAVRTSGVCVLCIDTSRNNKQTKNPSDLTFNLFIIQIKNTQIR